MYSNIWSHVSSPQSQSIKQLIEENKYRPFEDLLQCNDLILECSRGCFDLNEFLSRKEQIGRILHYLLIEPEKESNENRSRKFPYLCNQIVQCGIEPLIEEMSDKEHLDTIFNFLECEGKVNTVLAGYFEGLIKTIEEYQSEKLKKYVKERGEDELIDLLLKNIGNESIRKSLIHFKQIFLKPKSKRNESSLILKLIHHLGSEYSAKINFDSASTLCECINHLVIINETNKTFKPRPLFLYIQSEKVVKLIISHTFSTPFRESSFLSASKVLLYILNLRKRINNLLKSNEITYPLKSSDSESSNDENPFDDSEECNVSTFLSERFADMKRILENSTPKNEEKIGVVKLTTIELISSLLESRSESVENEMVGKKILRTIFELFLHFKWTTKLHNLVVAIISSVLNANSLRLKKNLFNEEGLIEMLDKAINNEKETVKGTINSAYKGHLFIILSMINEKMQNDLSISEICQGKNVRKCLEYFEVEKTRLSIRIGEKDFDELIDGKILNQRLEWNGENVIE